MTSQKTQNKTDATHNPPFPPFRWLLRFFVYSCIATTVTLSTYDFGTTSGMYSSNRWFDHWQRMSHEGENVVDLINGEQRYHRLTEGHFVTSLGAPQSRFASESPHYSYRIVSLIPPVQNLQEISEPLASQQTAISIGQSKKSDYPHYMGVVSLKKSTRNHYFDTREIICRIDNSTITKFEMPILEWTGPKCPKSWKRVF